MKAETICCYYTSKRMTRNTKNTASLARPMCRVLSLCCLLDRRVHLKGGVFSWLVSRLDVFCLRSVIYWFKNTWGSRLYIQ